jgi:hypothetical protein
LAPGVKGWEWRRVSILMRDEYFNETRIGINEINKYKIKYKCYHLGKLAQKE